MDMPSSNLLDGSLELVTDNQDPRLDTRLLAQYLGNQHKGVIELLNRHLADFQELGKVPFQTEALPSGQREKFAILNEDQCFLMLSFSRNTALVRGLKVQLIKAFGEARMARDMRRKEYLPGYHQLRKRIHVLAASSENEARVHMNVNKLVNKVAGIEAGQRSKATLVTQSMLVVAQLLAYKAMQGATDHRMGYQLAKSALQPLLVLTSAAINLEHSNG
jgi:phage regulator Rha-like protein